MEYKLFYDTNALLSLQDKAFEEQFIISQKTLEELENIKTSSNKDQEVKYKARKCSRLLDQNYGNYDVVITTTDIISKISDFKLEITPDTIILSAAYLYNQTTPVIFVTDDINAKCLSKLIFGLPTRGITELNLTTSEIEYTGYKDVTLSDEEMSEFYCNLGTNKFECLRNEYLIVRSSSGEVVDKYKWNGTEYKKVCNMTLRSRFFGDKIKPKDELQACVIDSIMSNTITAISGKAGSGKSLLSLVSIMSLIEKEEYDRVVILFNPSKVRGAVDMGFYTGDATDKAMQNSIGQILVTKFGDRFAVDMMLQQEKIKLVSMADARGMEIRDNEILYITECQNTSVDLLKLCLSRVSSESKVVIEGDYLSQVDSYAYENNNNGMKRAIDVFKGEELFGYVNLKNIWRSKIAELAEKM